MAYWSPRRKPFVPSIGSRHQYRGAISLDPISIHSQTWSSEESGMIVLTKSVTLERIPARFRPLSSLDVSSATIRSEGKAWCRIRQTTAWDPKSATVTGLRSALMIASWVTISFWTLWHSLAAATTHRKAISFWFEMALFMIPSPYEIRLYQPIPWIAGEYGQYLDNPWFT